MSHTEAEAKTKWCPFGRVLVHGGSMGWGAAVNRNSDILTEKVERSSKCLASACVVWVWRKDEIESEFYLEAHPEEALKGYCGLINKS